MTTLFLILIGVVILLCIWLNNVSSRIGIPTLLAFIVLGMVFGNNGLIPLHFEDYDFAKETCTVALIFIMFYGGFGTRWDSAISLSGGDGWKVSCWVPS
jgi:cell volume regulation protein A